MVVMCIESREPLDFRQMPHICDKDDENQHHTTEGSRVPLQPLLPLQPRSQIPPKSLDPGQ